MENKDFKKKWSLFKKNAFGFSTLEIYLNKSVILAGSNATLEKGVLNVYELTIYCNSSIDRKQVMNNSNKQSKRLEGFWKNY